MLRHVNNHNNGNDSKVNITIYLKKKHDFTEKSTLISYLFLS